MLQATSKILYVRAALKPVARPLKTAGGIIPYLEKYIDFDELFVPHFYGARPFWRKKQGSWPKLTNSGSLGKQIASSSNAVLSQHPTHAFAGYGPRVNKVLKEHNRNASCFEPIRGLAESHDFSMLLLGCCEESPGFSTVHASQHKLGLTKLHVMRFLMRWDFQAEGRIKSSVASESPGCSASFDKFYPYYKEDNNYCEGEWDGVKWIFIHSARQAMIKENELLQNNGRFVECGKLTCLSCRLRLY